MGEGRSGPVLGASVGVELGALGRWWLDRAMGVGHGAGMRERQRGWWAMVGGMGRRLAVMIVVGGMLLSRVVGQSEGPMLRDGAGERWLGQGVERDGGGGALEVTIAAALEALNAGEAESRAGAVMLLGKYPFPVAREGVLRGLDDPEARVRRAAVVAALDWRYEMPPGASLKLLGALADPDVEVRRQISAALPLLLSVQRTLALFGEVGGMSPRLMEVLRGAAADGDGLVRENFLAAFPLMNLQLPPERWLALVGDEVAGVRRRALPLAITVLPSEVLWPALQRWADSPEAAERQLLAEVLAQRTGSAAVGRLKALLGDADRRVVLQALISLLQLEPSPGVVKGVLAELARGDTPSELGRLALRWLAQRVSAPGRGMLHLDDGDLELLRGLGRSDWQVEVTRLLLEASPEASRRELIRVRLRDADRQVRAIALNYFERLPEASAMEGLWPLLESPYDDVRVRVVQRLPVLPVEVGDEVSRELLLDPLGEVRAGALQFRFLRRLPEWAEVLLLALNDGDPGVTRMAVTLWGRLPLAERQRWLDGWVDAHPQHLLAPAIRAMLMSEPLR